MENCIVGMQTVGMYIYCLGSSYADWKEKSQGLWDVRSCVVNGKLVVPHFLHVNCYLQQAVAIVSSSMQESVPTLIRSLESASRQNKRKWSSVAGGHTSFAVRPCIYNNKKSIKWSYSKWSSHLVQRGLNLRTDWAFRKTFNLQRTEPKIHQHKHENCSRLHYSIPSFKKKRSWLNKHCAN